MFSRNFLCFFATTQDRIFQLRSKQTKNVVTITDYLKKNPKKQQRKIREKKIVKPRHEYLRSSSFQVNLK